MTHPNGGSGSGSSGNSGTGPSRLVDLALIAFAEIFKILPRRAAR